MVIDKSHKYCSRCQRSQMHFRKGTNHILHLLLTVLMCGWWLPVWLLMIIKVGGWQCETCGYRGHPLIRYGIPAMSLCFLAVSCTTVWTSMDTARTPAKPRPQPAAPSSRVETPPVVPDTPKPPTDSPGDVLDAVPPETDPEPEPDTAPVDSTPVNEPDPPPASVDDPVIEPEPRWRTWTSADGQYTVEAEFVSFAMGDVKLRKKDGKTITLKMKQLSEADQEWIRKKGRRY